MRNYQTSKGFGNNEDTPINEIFQVWVGFKNSFFSSTYKTDFSRQYNFVEFVNK
jgi:hypothetical protein